MFRGLHRSYQSILDIEDLSAYIAAGSPEAALRFQRSVARTCAGLVEAPFRGRQFERGSVAVRSFRFVLVEGFPQHLIIYRVDGSRIEIARVLHGARDIAALLE